MAATRFRDRPDAGRVLAGLLAGYRGQSNLLVLALPRGGVPVAEVVAASLPAPLDVFVVRKLGVPGRAELAMGAIASGGVLVLNEDVVRVFDVDEEALGRVVGAEEAELVRRERAYRGDRPPAALAGKTVIVVDDGAATGATMRAALLAIARAEPARLVAAVPVAPAEVCAELELLADEVVCASSPVDFAAVGGSYDRFDQTGDDEVRALLAR
ncbi:phosphoribosyltransferase [Tomitella biformata]|uniref:phosphoribosyltransferase n=1 Tax=Tomitella biformata TaxID=630403 RepID=UPI000464A18D|nr:phosphoribosyltransferase [Tomitella biformata]